MVLIQFFNLAFDTETKSWLGILPSRVASSSVCVFCIGICSDEGKSLTLLRPLLNRQLHFDLGGIGDVLSVSFQLLLTCDIII